MSSSFMHLALPLMVAGVCPGSQFGTPPAGYADVPDAATYDAALKNLDLHAVVEDLQLLLTSSQPCWPADYGNYGPLFIRLAWHCSGTYRKTDRRGGCGGGRQRFEPERSWPDNTNLDKARALLWPVKEKYGDGLSWGDLFTLAGTVAITTMGGPVTHYCAGRIDSADGTESNVLGPTPEQERIAPCEVNGLCQRPLGASTVGLIYVNPEGPVVQGANGTWAPDPNPVASARDIRDIFTRMGFNDIETVALIGGGHAFGKAHGSCTAGAGPPPSENQFFPWPGMCGTGKGADTFTSGMEGPWSTNPTRWDNEFFVLLRKLEWQKHVGPGGHWQWKPRRAQPEHAGLMRLTTDMALLHDRSYRHIVKTFAKHPRKLDTAFARAWFQLTTDGGYWSKERKCISVKPMRPMRGDDINTFATDANVDVLTPWTGFVAVVFAAIGALTAGALRFVLNLCSRPRPLDGVGSLADPLTVA